MSIVDLIESTSGIGAIGADDEDAISIEIPLSEADLEGLPDNIPVEAAEEGEDPLDKFNENLAEELDEQILHSIASDLCEMILEDENSRKDHKMMYYDGLELLGMKLEERQDPWPGACGVYHPLLTEALIKFQAETMIESFPATGPVNTEVIGKETPEKVAAARRVQDDMNYTLLEVMPEFRCEHELMLWGTGLSGNGFKKVYYDPHLERPMSMYVQEEDMIVPYGASSLKQAERITHMMRKTEEEIKRLQISGFYRDVPLPPPAHSMDEGEKRIAEQLGFTPMTDNRYRLYEVHTYLDIPGYEDPSGLALPYVVTLERDTQLVLAIRRNWRPEDRKKERRTHFVHYGYIPGFGFYRFGLLHLIGTFAKSSTSILRQLVDAGTLSNIPAGFKVRGMRGKDDDTPMRPGEWRDVDVPSGTLRDAMLPLPYKEPSATLFQLLQNLVEEARRYASTADMQMSDMGSQATPVGTTLAVLERAQKVMSAVQARIHYSFKEELRLIRDVIRDFMPDEYAYAPDDDVTGVDTDDDDAHDDHISAKKADYEMVDIIPVSNPQASTMAQRVAQYQAALQLSQQAPQLYNLPLLHREMLHALGIKNAQKLVPMDDDAKPMDPVSENQCILTMRPVKAFQYQDHQSHITVHRNLMQDPHVQQELQNNPQAQQMIAAVSAHIAEHVAMEYRAQMQEIMGFNLPPLPPKDGEESEDDDFVFVDPKEEEQISQLAKVASDELLQRSQTAMAAKQAQQAAQDPVIQMQQQELQIKQQELQLKKQEIEQNYELKHKELDNAHQVNSAKIEIDGYRTGSDISHRNKEFTAKNEIEGVKLSQDALNKDRDFKAKQELEGYKLGSQIAKDHRDHHADNARHLHDTAVDLAKTRHATEDARDRYHHEVAIDLAKTRHAAEGGMIDTIHSHAIDLAKTKYAAENQAAEAQMARDAASQDAAATQAHAASEAQLDREHTTAQSQAASKDKMELAKLAAKKAAKPAAKKPAAKKPAAKKGK